MIVERQEFQYNEAHNFWAMLKLTAIDGGFSFGVKERIGIDFVVVIDVSKSMNSDNKLPAVLATLEYMMENLTENDRFALVQFNDVATLLFDLLPMNDINKSIVVDILHNIKATGNTNINDGLITGLNILKSRKEENPPISRLFLLTDGLTNRGFSHKQIIKNIKSQNNDDRMTIYCFGYGVDHSSSVLQTIAFSTAGGLYYYVKNSDKIASTFGECLAGIFSTIAYSIRVHLEAFDGCRFVKIRTKYLFNTIQSMKNYIGFLGSMYEQEQRTILMRLSLRDFKSVCEHKLFTISVSYCSAINNLQYKESATVVIQRSQKPKRLFIPLELDVQINRVTSAEAIDFAITSANENNFGIAQQTLLSAIKKISSSSSASEPYCVDLITDLTECIKYVSGPDSFVGSKVHQIHQYSTMYNQERSVGISPKKHVNRTYGYTTEQQIIAKKIAEKTVSAYLSNYHHNV